MTTTLAERNVAQHTAKKKWGHVLPSGGEDRGRLVLREADPLSKYLMSFRTVGLFQPLPLQNNSHYIPSLVIIYACRAPKTTSRSIHHKKYGFIFPANLWLNPSLLYTLTVILWFNHCVRKTFINKFTNNMIKLISYQSCGYQCNIYIIIFTILPEEQRTTI